MLISLIDQNLVRLGNLGDLPVTSLLSTLGQDHSVIVASESQTSASAFRLMSERGVRGLGVVNSSGELVDSMSVRDLRALGDDDKHFYERLNLSISKFKAKAREIFKTQTPLTPIVVTQSDDIATLIRRFDDGIFLT